MLNDRGIVMERFILSKEESLFSQYRKEYPWYPYWNENSGDYHYNIVICRNMMFIEQDSASISRFSVTTMKSREQFQYRVPSNHVEEQFCRGQF